MADVAEDQIRFLAKVADRQGAVVMVVMVVMAAGTAEGTVGLVVTIAPPNRD